MALSGLRILFSTSPLSNLMKAKWAFISVISALLITITIRHSEALFVLTSSTKTILIKRVTRMVLMKALWRLWGSNGFEWRLAICLHLLHYALIFWRESYSEWRMETFLLYHESSSLWEHTLFPFLYGGASSAVWPNDATWWKAVITNVNSPNLWLCYHSEWVNSPFHASHRDHTSTPLTSPACRCTDSTCPPPPSSPPSIVARVPLSLCRPVPTLPFVLPAPHAGLPTLWTDTLSWTQSLKGSPSGFYSL